MNFVQQLIIGLVETYFNNENKVYSFTRKKSTPYRLLVARLVDEINGEESHKITLV